MSITFTFRSSELHPRVLQRAVEGLAEQIRTMDPKLRVEITPHVERPLILIDRGERRVYVGAKLVDMPVTSHRLLTALYEARGPVLVADLTEAVGVASGPNPIRQVVRRTRAALGPLRLIETLRPSAYRLNPIYTYIETGEQS